MKENEEEVKDLFESIRGKRKRLHIDSQNIIEEMKRMYPDMSEVKKHCLEREDLSLSQRVMVAKGIDSGLNDEQMEVLAVPELEVWQMQIVLVGLTKGLTLQEIEPVIDQAEVLSIQQRNGMLETILAQKNSRVEVKESRHTVMTTKIKKERKAR